jgi:hypothetical protein
MGDDSKRLRPGDPGYGTHMSHCYDNDPMVYGGHLCFAYGQEETCPMAPVAVERAKEALGQRAGDAEPRAADLAVWMTRSGAYVAVPAGPGRCICVFFSRDGSPPSSLGEGAVDEIRKTVLALIEGDGELLDAAQPLLLRESVLARGRGPGGP